MVSLNLLIVVLSIFQIKANFNDYWLISSNLSQWYNSFDQCLLSNQTNNSVDIIASSCESIIRKKNGKINPIRCRVGNSWPSKSGFCSSEDIPYSERENFRKSLKGFDDPSRNYLLPLFRSLSLEKGALLLIGDSVMQQFYSAMACELERTGIWPDPSLFTNTDEVKHVLLEEKFKISPLDSFTSVPIKFLPIYHFVNGRWDRIPNASMHHLKKTIEEYLSQYDSLLVMLNMGLHYVSNPVPHFSRPDYRSQMNEAFNYLHTTSINNPSKKLRILWRETSAQHFPTPNGYWPGVKYAADMKLQCVPINDTSLEADWRNADVKEIIESNQYNSIKIVPFYNITIPLWSQHVNGHMRDCTHFCWTPMLYQYLFYQLAEAMKIQPLNFKNN